MYTSSDQLQLDIINDIQDFISLHLPDMLLIYEELKRLYHYSSPFFLDKMQFHHLVDLFIYHLFKEHTLQSKTTPTHFIQFYYTELHFSYNLVQSFFKKHSKHNLPIQDWDNFCYTLTDLYEIRD